MKTITSKQLAYILSISHKDSMKIMLRAKRKNGEVAKETDWEFVSEVVADIEIVSKETNADIEMAVNDIRENSLKRPAFRKWILYDYVSEKLKGKTPPKKISLPPALKSLLPEEAVSYIRDFWNEKFSNYKNPDWSDDDVSIKFEP
jgi:hypothetical protein